LREELTATAGERIWLSNALPYWSEVSRRLHWTILGIALLAGVGIGTAVAATRSSGTPVTAPISAIPELKNPYLDPGSPLKAAAPAFTLTDQFGKRISLGSFRGKVVVLTFNDPECTTICPLTTTALLYAKELLGPAASRVQLLGVGANPEATQVKFVRDYSRVHRMMRKWRFLTGSLPELRRVWHDYGIEAAVINDAIDHTPATYVIDMRGRESRLFLTQMAYSSVNQLGYEIARSIAPLLPGHPRLQSTLPLAAPVLSGPRDPVTLPRADGGQVGFGPGSGSHLVLFFDTWDSEVTDLAKQLVELNDYVVAARRHGLPDLVAVDEDKVEPSTNALPRFLHGLPRPLRYPVVVDKSGTFADGYRVQDSPYLELVSRTGSIVLQRDIAVRGWPTLRTLIAQARTK
jgi:cytochrome oxidase Cu insertion factor (SCO1/SenC/PrrC family)